jgi:hypothetical protein
LFLYCLCLPHNILWFFQELSQWSEAVVLPATRIVSQFLNDVPIEWSQILTFQSSESLEEWKKYECKICGGRILNGAREWTEHLNSRQHRRRCQTQIQNSPSSPVSTLTTEPSSSIPLPNFSILFQSNNSDGE